MLVCYTLECGHALLYRKYVKLKDGKRWCKKCRKYKEVTDVRVTPPLSKFISFH